jgi:hypothetical protein
VYCTVNENLILSIFRVVNGETCIPVASNLPPGYLSYRILEPGRVRVLIVYLINIYIHLTDWFD